VRIARAEIGRVAPGTKPARTAPPPMFHAVELISLNDYRLQPYFLPLFAQSARN
jgi:hypothetical protein